MTTRKIPMRHIRPWLAGTGFAASPVAIGSRARFSAIAIAIAALLLCAACGRLPEPGETRTDEAGCDDRASGAIAKAKRISVYDAGGSAAPARLMMELSDDSVTRHFDANGKALTPPAIVESTTDLLRSLPRELISCPDRNLASPNDSSGHIYVIDLEDGTSHSAAVFSEIAYSEEISAFDESIDAMLRRPVDRTASSTNQP